MTDPFDRFISTALQPPVREPDADFVLRVRLLCALDARDRSERRDMVWNLVVQAAGLGAMAAGLAWLAQAAPVAAFASAAPHIALPAVVAAFALVVVAIAAPLNPDGRRRID